MDGREEGSMSIASEVASICQNRLTRSGHGTNMEVDNYLFVVENCFPFGAILHITMRSFQRVYMPEDSKRCVICLDPNQVYSDFKNRWHNCTGTPRGPLHRGPGSQRHWG